MCSFSRHAFLEEERIVRGCAVALLAALIVMGRGVRRGPDLAAAAVTTYGLELQGDLCKVTDVTAPTVCAT